MRIAVIGHGNVGGALADRLQRLGHNVAIAVRDQNSGSLLALMRRNPSLLQGPPLDVVKNAELVILATPFQAVEEALTPLADSLVGKVLVDCTNPIGSGLTHGLRSERSGTELIQALLPRTRVVKAFSIYGYENFGEPFSYGSGQRPAMLFCGNDPSAKAVVAGLLEELGWQPMDVGGAEQALHLEHMTLLWVRMVRMGGHSPRTVWAALMG